MQVSIVSVVHPFETLYPAEMSNVPKNKSIPNDTDPEMLVSDSDSD